jgi:hypothetical protein
MSSLKPQLPLKLGQSVQHRFDATRAVGIILGWIFDAPVRALVRWQHDASTYELPRDLVDLAHVLGIPEAMSIADQVRERIRHGILPVTEPVTTMSIKQSKWHSCDACDELMAPGQVIYAVGYHTPPRVLRLHWRCHGVWQAERRRLGRPVPSSAPPGSLQSLAAEVNCPICTQPIEARQNVVFRRDGQVEHVTCTEPTRKPLARVVPETVAADPMCPACSEPIRATDSVASEGDTIVHVRCFARRPIAGGAPLLPWAMLADLHVGSGLGLTPAGHSEFMLACAEARLLSRHVVDQARSVVRASRALRPLVGGIALPRARVA